MVRRSLGMLVLCGLLFAAVAWSGEEKAAAGARGAPKTGDGAAAAAPAAPAKAEEPKKLQASFILADGSRVSGETELKEVAIKTVYGDLVVPVTDVLLLRVARNADKDNRAKVETLIKQLGAANFDDREKAYDELYKLGSAALSQLREAVKSTDAEVRSRAEKLLADLERAPGEEEEENAPLSGDEDEVVARRFTIRGVVKIDKFDVQTRYGKLEIPREQLVSATFGKADSTAKTVKVMGGNARNAMLATGIKLKAGDRVQLRASGSINFQNWGRTCTPDGDTDRFGTFDNNIPGMGLMGRIGTNNNAERFFVGSSKTFTAESSGELFLGIAYNSNTGQSTGDYKVIIMVTPKK